MHTPVVIGQKLKQTFSCNVENGMEATWIVLKQNKSSNSRCKHKFRASKLTNVRVNVLVVDLAAVEHNFVSRSDVHACNNLIRMFILSESKEREYISVAVQAIWWGESYNGYENLLYTNCLVMEEGRRGKGGEKTQLESTIVRINLGHTRLFRLFCAFIQLAWCVILGQQ